MLRAAAYTEADLLPFFDNDLTEHVLGGPDCTVPGEITDPGRVVDGIAQYSEFQLTAGVIGAKPLLAVIQTNIQVKIIQPTLAFLPVTAEISHHFP